MVGSAARRRPPDAFAGQLVETPYNLNDFQHRPLAPMMDRWLSPDPAGIAAVNLSDPQSWNAYACVGDTPLEATDPLGLNGNGSTGCGVGQPADGACPIITIVVNDWQCASCPNPGPPPAWVSANLQSVGYCSASPDACLVAGLSQHSNGPGSVGGGFGGNGVVAAAMAVPQGNSCSKWQRMAGDASQYAESVSHAARWVAIGAGIGALISGALEVPTAGTDTPATAALASAGALTGEVSISAGAAAAVLKSYANGNYGAMASFDWKHLAADATYLASTQIPGASNYAEQLAQLADVGLDISVSSPLRCQ